MNKVTEAAIIIAAIFVGPVGMIIYAVWYIRRGLRQRQPQGHGRLRHRKLLPQLHG